MVCITTSMYILLKKYHNVSEDISICCSLQQIYAKRKHKIAPCIDMCWDTEAQGFLVYGQMEP